MKATYKTSSLKLIIIYITYLLCNEKDQKYYLTQNTISRVKSSGVRQSKITKWSVLACLGEKRLRKRIGTVYIFYCQFFIVGKRFRYTYHDKKHKHIYKSIEALDRMVRIFYQFFSIYCCKTRGTLLPGRPSMKTSVLKKKTNTK